MAPLSARKCVLIILIGGCVLLGGVAEVTAKGPQSDIPLSIETTPEGERVAESWWNPFSDGDDATTYGINTTMAVWLFGTGQPTHGEVFDNKTKENIQTQGDISSEQMIRDFTYQWNQPVELPEEWNENTFDEYDKTRPTSKSSYPIGSNVKNSTYIKRAHGSIFSISRGTYVHRENTSVWEIPESSSVAAEVRAEVDFLVVIPEDRYDPNPPGEDVLSKRWEYTLTEAKVTRYRLLADGEVIDTREARGNGKNEHISTAVFDTNGISGEGDLTVEAVIESSINEKITTRVRVERTDEDGDTYTTVVTRVTNNVLSDRVEVSESRQYQVRDLDGVKVGVYDLPNNQTGSLVSADHAFAGYDIGEDQVRTGWSFYSKRDPRWDKQEVVQRESRTTLTNERVNETAIPVRFNAVPSGYQPTLNTSDANRSGTISLPEDEELHSQPEIDENLSIARKSNYTEQKSIRVTHPNNVTGQDITLYGLTRLEADRSPNTQSVGKTNLTITNATRDTEYNRPTKITIEIRDNQTGEHLSQVDSGGRIVIPDYPNDRRVEYGDNGKVTVRTNESGVFSVYYDPPLWTDVDQPHTEARAYGQVHTLPDQGTIRRWLVDIFIRLLPVFTAIYVVNGLRQMFKTGRQQQN